MVEQVDFPAPGHLYDIGSHKMHLYSLGEGSPVVLLDAGSGDSLLTWNAVHAEIAKFTRVVAYDRSGMGWSERGPNPSNPENVAHELQKLLLAAEIKEPLILVGHSLGGVYMRVFARLYPEQVVGLILIDSSHESQAARFAETTPQYLQISKDSVALLKELSQKSHHEIVDHFFKTDETNAAPISEIEAMRRDRLRPTQLATVVEELEYAYQHSLNQPPEAISSLGDLPVVALTATKPFRVEGLSDMEGDVMRKTFQDLQTEISQRSSRGEQIFVQDAGHYIQNDQPQVVIDTVRNMVERMR